MSGIERHMIARGCAFYSPIRYSELPRYYRELDCPDDVAMFQVAPMDKHGYFNFGPSASHLGAMCETARHIIVEVNENMPRCLGGTENGIHISKVNAIVEGSNPPLSLGPGIPAFPADSGLCFALPIFIFFSLIKYSRHNPQNYKKYNVPAGKYQHILSFFTLWRKRILLIRNQTCH